MVAIALKALVAHAFIRRQQTQRELGIVDATEELVESSIHMSGVADDLFEGGDESVKIGRDAGKRG